MPQKKQKLRVFDIGCLAFTAFFSIELVSSQASIGPSMIVCLLVFGVVYLITHGLISAELGSTYPDQGGSYIWIQKAFGARWAARVAWWCWVNMVSFVPSVFVALIIVLQQIFQLSLSSMEIALVSVLGTWAIVATNCVSIRSSKIISNVGAVFKLIFCIALIAGALWFAFSNGIRNEFTFETIMPELDFGLLALMGTFVYGLTGLELASANAGEMQNPKKDVPRALLATGAVSVIIYLLSALAVLFVLPQGEIDQASGMIDAIIAVYGASQVAVVVIGVILAIVYISYIFSWTIGGNSVALEAGEQGEFPAAFAKCTKSHAPSGAAVLMGIGATALVLVYGLTADSGSNLFWSLLAFTSITFFPAYFLIAFALFKLRKADPDTERPFKIPGKLFPRIVVGVNVACLSIASIAYLIPPAGEDPLSYTLFIVGGIFVVLAVGELIVASAAKKRKAAASSEQIGEVAASSDSQNEGAAAAS